MGYIENPKTRGSGIICCIPHDSKCPNECKDCFFQSGRSYLEPLEDNLPNMPSTGEVLNRVVRVNDGHDSSFEIDMVITSTRRYLRKFYNTSIPSHLHRFDAPVMLTVNPGPMTDKDFHALGMPSAFNSLMAVRARVNTWNLPLVDQIVAYYTPLGIPVILTFMRYYEDPVLGHSMRRYGYRKHVLNSYYAITDVDWERVMARYKSNNLVCSCGTEGEGGTPFCLHCGNCLRTYFAAIERRRNV